MCQNRQEICRPWQAHREQGNWKASLFPGWTRLHAVQAGVTGTTAELLMLKQDGAVFIIGPERRWVLLEVIVNGERIK